VTQELIQAGQPRWQASATRSPCRVSVVIPARNEARNIAWVLEHIPLEVDEIVLVDGHSTDRTIEVALSVRPDTVVVVDDAPGKGCAIRKGIETATGDFVVMLDADGSMDPCEITRFVHLLCDDHDLVRGSRFLPGGGTVDMSRLRMAGNRGFLLLTRLLYGVSRSDLCYGYAGFRRSSIMALDLTATGFEIEAQLFLRAERAGLSIAEVPSFEAPRHAGTSNLHTFRDGWRVLKTILAERKRNQPILGFGAGLPLSQGVAVPVGDGARGEVIAIDIERPILQGRSAARSTSRWSRRGLRPGRLALERGRRDPGRVGPMRTSTEQAMTAALVWSLAVQHKDHRLQAVALNYYRDARRQARAALPVPGTSRLLEMRQELATLRS
jgi:hypothetical protein